MITTTLAWNRTLCSSSCLRSANIGRELRARSSISFNGHQARGALTAENYTLRRDRGRNTNNGGGSNNVKALVQIDLGPSVVLGSSLMVSAIALYQVRASRPEVSRDKDVFFSSIGLLCGGILIFQGWRLDPLMLFGQLLTTATAVAFATETISLRQELLDTEVLGGNSSRVRPGRGRGGRRSGRARSLPQVVDREIESRVDYARSGYLADNSFDADEQYTRAGEYDRTNASLSFNRGSTDAYFSDDGEDSRANNDVSDTDDADSPYRDGFRAAAGNPTTNPNLPRPSSKNWEDDAWDFE